VHARTWLEFVAYIPAAMRERAARKRAGISECKFWKLVIRRPQFFPGTANDVGANSRG
jgi:hypothetical protein